MKNQNIDLQKAICFIKSIYIYLYTLIYIFVQLKMYIENGITMIHHNLKVYPYYMSMFNKVSKYYTNVFSYYKNDMEREMDDISDIIKKLD